jgi:hypothetical protein
VPLLAESLRAIDSPGNLFKYQEYTSDGKLYEGVFGGKIFLSYAQKSVGSRGFL